MPNARQEVIKHFMGELLSNDNSETNPPNDKGDLKRSGAGRER
jgi:hypothetical protein